MILNLGSIVEGHGDVAAVPTLLGRIQRALAPDLVLTPRRPWRTGRYKLVKEGEIETAVERLARQLRPPRAILILIDAEDDCPAKLGPELLARARQTRPDIPIGLVLAKFEYEAWFLAALESLRGHCGLEENMAAPEKPETIRGAKGYLTHRMTGSRAYRGTTDQLPLTRVFDMQMARRCNSFDKCWREVERLISEAAEHGREGGNPVGSD